MLHPEACLIGWLLQVLGTGLVLIALADIFFTVLYARSDASLLSDRFRKGLWQLFRSTALALPHYKDRLLTYAGPILLVLTVGLWVSLLLVGFALIAWPALGFAIRASSGDTPTGFAAALYYAGYSLTTLGTGDLVPQSAFYRLLTILEAVVGFSVLTLSLTFFTSIYSALVRRNAFALGLHHRTLGTADATMLLSQLGPSGDFSAAPQELTAMSDELLNLYVSHHFYPMLHYFRFQEASYALARITLLALDTATLIRSALDERTYASLIHSAAVSALWGGGMQLLEGISATFLPSPQPGKLERLEPAVEQRWRVHYERSVGKLQAEGITVVEDVAAGAAKYVALRRQWGQYIVAFAAYMAYDWDEIAAQETNRSTP